MSRSVLLRLFLIFPYVLAAGFIIFLIIESDYFYPEWAIPGFLIIFVLFLTSYGILKDKKIAYSVALFINFLILIYSILGIFGPLFSNGEENIGLGFYSILMFIPLSIVLLTSLSLFSLWKKTKN